MADLHPSSERSKAWLEFQAAVEATFEVARPSLEEDDKGIVAACKDGVLIVVARGDNAAWLMGVLEDPFLRDDLGAMVEDVDAYIAAREEYESSA